MRTECHNNMRVLSCPVTCVDWERDRKRKKDAMATAKKGKRRKSRRRDAAPCRNRLRPRVAARRPVVLYVVQQAAAAAAAGAGQAKPEAKKKPCPLG